MGKKKPKRKSGTNTVAQLALVTAILTLITSIFNFARQLIEWLTP